MAVVEAHHRAMASAVHVAVAGGPAELTERALARLDFLEQRWSRFIAGSDIDRLNHANGEWIEVDPSTTSLLIAMRRCWTMTRGLVDPTLLPSLMEAGYTTSIDDPARVTHLPEGRSSGSGLSSLEIDPDGRARLDTMVSLDPGSIGKGLAADIVSEELVRSGADAALVNVGGDLSMAGLATPPWHVEVEHPTNPELTSLTLSMVAGGIATSSTRTRTWEKHGVLRHHTIDPRTGSPAETDVASVTTISDMAADAEAWSTAALIAGAGAGYEMLVAAGVDAVIGTSAGAILVTPGLIEEAS